MNIQIADDGSEKTPLQEAEWHIRVTTALLQEIAKITKIPEEFINA